MRFDKIEFFNIDDLVLDEGNYRFRKASDQRQCIEKIYQSSPDNFKTIITSVAEDDLGELLLIYQNENGDNIVMDGNRRVSALKVLHNPALSPTETIQKRVTELLNTYKIEFDKIQAQVSDDKNLILRTLYERHGAGGGKSRLNWPALARSRFGYDNQMDMPDAEWKVIALLYKLEEIDPTLINFFDSSSYKHEVFRRIIPEAIRLNIISGNIFSDRDRRIKSSAKSLIQSAYRVCVTILNDIKTDVIGLSRDGTSIYASSEGVNDYLKRFIKNNSASNSVNNDEENGEANNTEKENEAKDTKNSSNNNTESSDNESNGGTSAGQSNNGVTFSVNVDQAIKKTKSKKFSQLYKSICTISLTVHPSLVVLGCWALIEAVATASGKKDDVSIDGFFSKQLINNRWPNIFPKTQQDDFRNALEFIRKEANGIKHSSTYRSDSAANLRPHFECLEPLFIKALEKLVQDHVKVI